jgi:hypothetical protein
MMNHIVRSFYSQEQRFALKSCPEGLWRQPIVRCVEREEQMNEERSWNSESQVEYT